MTQDRSAFVPARLEPDVESYGTKQFTLKEDLERLDRVRRVDAPEAVVLYCTRILDVLAADALRTVKLKPSSNVFSNLEALRQYFLIEPAACSWAHALRRLGNRIRHVNCRSRSGDAEWAVLFLERWLAWFFCTFRCGRCLSSLTRDGEPLGLSADADLHDLLESLESSDQNLYLSWERVREALRAPELPALLAELMLDRGAHADARTVLNAALKEFPDDLRLCQLAGLHGARTGNLEEALRNLEPLYKQYPDDEETAGMTAGVYKRLGLKDQGGLVWLEKARRAYRRGWERSKKTNAYLGINAATTALWLDRPAESRQVAEEVTKLLRDRAAALGGPGSDPELAFNYWDQVTLAEAELLLGELAAARRAYRDTFARHAEDQRGNIKVSRDQICAILPVLGLSYGAAAFLERPPVDATVTVGVTGHRRLPDAERLTERIHEALSLIRQVKAADGGPRFAALSALAEGADRLVAEAVLSPEVDGLLYVVLPLELADYRTDFTSEASRAEFQVLLDRAEAIQFPPLRLPSGARRGPRAAVRAEPRAGTKRDAAYEWGGRYVVDHCDVLVALWDGQPSRGQGGTAEVVAYARRVDRPLIWIRTTPPYDVIAERLDKLQD